MPGCLDWKRPSLKETHSKPWDNLDLLDLPTTALRVLHCKLLVSWMRLVLPRAQIPFVTHHHTDIVYTPAPMRNPCWPLITVATPDEGSSSVGAAATSSWSGTVRLTSVVIVKGSCASSSTAWPVSPGTDHGRRSLEPPPARSPR